MARPTKLTIEITEAIAKTVEAGNFIETAAALAGVSRTTLRVWLSRGNKARSGLYREFRDRIKGAQAKAEIDDVERIETAASDPKQWQAAAWRLERRNWKRWGKKDKLQSEISGPNKKPIQTESFRYSVAIAGIAPRPMEDSEPFGTDQSDLDGPPLGKVANG